jgi:hypothetical protein
MCELASEERVEHDGMELQGRDLWFFVPLVFEVISYALHSFILCQNV